MVCGIPRIARWAIDDREKDRHWHVCAAIVTEWKPGLAADSRNPTGSRDEDAMVKGVRFCRLEETKSRCL